MKENYIEKDINTFIDYLNFSNFWFDVFKPNVNGERPQGLLSTAFYKRKDKDVLIKRIKEYNGKGIVCLAINDRKDRDKTIQSIDFIHSLVIDIDVKKSFKKGHVSLPEHHNKALETADAIKTYLKNKGFKTSMIVDSGNGAQLYIYLCEHFSDEYKEQRKQIIKDITDDKKRDKAIKELIKKQELLRRVESFEKDLKTNFNQDFIEIDNITKDVNRRMKIPGTLNKKDEEQIEDRIANIIYFNNDFKHDDRDNYEALSKYDPTPLKIVVSKDNTPKIIQSDSKVLYRLNLILNSKKDKDKEFKKTYNALNLDELFGGDRSAAEQSMVNSFYFRGFKNFEDVHNCMINCKIGKWNEKDDSYRTLTFEKAQTLYNQKMAEKQDRRTSFESSFQKYQIYLLSDDPKTKYLIHNSENGEYTIKNGNDSLSDYLYPQLQSEKIDLNELKIYYPDSNSKPKNLLIDFIQDNAIINILNDTAFKPIDVLTFEEEGKTFYNTYRPTQYLSINKSDKVINLLNECPCIDNLIFNVCGNDILAKEYIIKLLAFILQNPHIKTEKLIILFGEEGSGKGLTFNCIIKPIFEKYAVSLNQDVLDAPYNGQMSQKLIVYFNEVENNKEKENILKNWTTEPTVIINEKYGGMREEKSFFTIFADVNNNNPITAGERRTVYLKSKTLGGSYKKSQELGELYVKEIPKELPNFVQYLKNLEVTHSEIREGYETQAKKDVLDNIKTVDKQFIDLMDEYTTLKNFTDAVYGTHNLVITYYIEKEWIEVNFLLNCFNNFRMMKGLRNPIVLNKFSWIYDALGVDRENSDQVRRKANTSGHKVYWIKLKSLMDRFKDVEVQEVMKNETKII